MTHMKKKLITQSDDLIAQGVAKFISKERGDE